jgi:hypothetical protein
MDARPQTSASADDAASHIWWGPIASERQAREIIAWTAWSLLLLGVAPGAAMAMAAARGEIAVASPFYANQADNWYVLGQAIFLTVESLAALTLLRFQSWTSALVLLVCCVFVITLLLASIGRVAMGGGLDLMTVGENLVLVGCLGLFTLLAWRSMAAAAALKRLRTTEHFD